MAQALAYQTKQSPVKVLQKRGYRGEREVIEEVLVGPRGPNEISLNSIDGLKTICGGNFDKHAWYANVFKNYSIENAFSMTTSGPHRERKRLFANVYSKSYLQNSKEVLQFSKTLLFDRLMPILQTAAETDSAVDILELGAAVRMDWTCAFVFGLNAGSNFIEDAKYRKYWLDRYEETKEYFTEIAEGYALPLVLLNKIGIKYLPDSCAGVGRGNG